MEFKLPANVDKKVPTIDAHTLVVIGANGAGKTSFGKEIVRQHPDEAIYISGLHGLFVNFRGSVDSLIDLKSFHRLIADRLLSSPLSDYERLILQLQQEEFEAAVNYKEAGKKEEHPPLPITKIDRIQVIWEHMFPHNRLVRKSGFFELASTSRDGQSYTAERMSDGEKAVFYFIGSVLCAPPEALLIIEEPELLLHNSIKNNLWDEIEAMRPDCTYIYLTHDIDFATSRTNSIRLWIRAFNADLQEWDYEIIEGNTSLPEELYIEILGNRKPILFIEGTDANSLDNRLYPLIFPEYLVKPMGGCQKVIETTKAFTQLKDFHTLDSKGIVDRDRRTPGEIAYLREQNIFVPDVAEVENLLMLEPIIRTVARRMLKDPDLVFQEVKESVIELFTKELEAQIILHAKHWVRKKLETIVDRKITTVEQLNEHVQNIRENIHVNEIYHKIKTDFEQYASSGDYKSILRVYNQKGMLPQSRLCGLCGLRNKETYFDFILSILKEKSNDATVIREAIRKSLDII
ncbi:DUF4435 domain-containing protein [Parabacteroides sp. Marseille-P3160]|uniref:DUF4435 domain-containing protein n=1 Tax=Parabacteroides sp. Marseille-P3160 TaxID=1917887 RepID=UPI0009BC2E96|nr:DUF4435 domain-containing protein [Parabacteroides sp. Marseille-P3160]